AGGGGGPARLSLRQLERAGGADGPAVEQVRLGPPDAAPVGAGGTGGQRGRGGRGQRRRRQRRRVHGRRVRGPWARQTRKDLRRRGGISETAVFAPRRKGVAGGSRLQAARGQELRREQHGDSGGHQWVRENWAQRVPG